MTKKILVPLDRSEVAEAVLPFAAGLARGTGAIVRLVHVAPVAENLVSQAGRVLAYSDQEAERLEAEGLDHLRDVAARLDVPAECAIRVGNAAEEILREAEACQADLIAMTTTGKSGFRRVVMGSVAERVLHGARVPVLLYHPGERPD